MSGEQAIAPEGSAVRVALWRALHAEHDMPPIIDDRVGLALADPPPDWRARPDMDIERTRAFRASIVARARYVEDLALARMREGVTQYVILGAGLDSFVQRHAEIGAKLKVFEVDQAGPQAWKRRRLAELGLAPPEWLRFAPVDFERGEDWWSRLTGVGFDPARPAIVTSLGVSMYLTAQAIEAMLRQVAALAPGSTLVMSFLLPLHMADPGVRVALEHAAQGAAASGAPFISFFTPPELLALARAAGFSGTEHVSAADLAARYFFGRSDGLRPPNNSEELLIATV